METVEAMTEPINIFRAANTPIKQRGDMGRASCRRTLSAALWLCDDRASREREESRLIERGSMALHAQIPKPPKDPPPEPVRKPNGEPLEDPLEPPDERPPSPVPEPPYEIPPEPPPASSDDAPVKVWTTGRYGRPVVTAYDGDRDLHLALLEQGWAVVFRRFLPDSLKGAYLAAEADAKAAKRGLWQGKFIVPSKWRRGGRLEWERR